MTKDRLFKQLIWENILKNTLILMVVSFLFGFITQGLESIQIDSATNFLTMVSILLVTVCFANFAFSYGNMAQATLNSFFIRFFAHLTTFLFILVTAILLVVFIESLKMIYPSLFPPILLISILLYLSIVLYDFWDIIRVVHQ